MIWSELPFVATLVFMYLPGDLVPQIKKSALSQQVYRVLHREISEFYKEKVCDIINI